MSIMDLNTLKPFFESLHNTWEKGDIEDTEKKKELLKKLADIFLPYPFDYVVSQFSPRLREPWTNPLK